MSRRAVLIKSVDFKTVSRVNPEYRGQHAITWWDNGGEGDPVIQMDSSLPKISRYGRRWVLFHELTHVKIHDLKIKMKKWDEELYCEFEGLLRTSDRDLGYNERAMKRMILNGRRWNNMEHRQAIILDMLRALRISLGPSDVSKLVRYKNRKVVLQA